jgi:hypothetical protein
MSNKEATEHTADLLILLNNPNNRNPIWMSFTILNWKLVRSFLLLFILRVIGTIITPSLLYSKI